MTLTDVLVDLRQMMESPHAFLYGSITSRWELVFGNNHMFGRKDEMDAVMNACCKVEEVDSPTAAILISGHAGAGKSRFVQEVRKSLKGRGWTFLRCKFEKAIASEPLSVIALGLDEFFVSTMPCFSSNSFMDNGGSGVECTCSKQSCPRRIIRELNRNDRVGLDGIRSLSQWMPSLKRLVKEAYPMHAEYLEGGFEHQGQGMPEQEVENLIQLLGVLLEILASACPVLFFVDDVSLYCRGYFSTTCRQTSLFLLSSAPMGGYFNHFITHKPHFNGGFF
jgi:predicted ATPase